MDKTAQIVDYMIDLRNSYNVRFVFGILTTYEEWRVLWFEDTDVAAKETDKEKFDELCLAGTAYDYSISDEVSVFTTRVYRNSELALVELLASVMYKISMTPISRPTKFAEKWKKYVLVTQKDSTYKSLPSRLLKNNSPSLHYRMP
ncbi:hypothetical protein MP638_002672, partial [Amoeboaphelidium occidentale]